MSRIIVRQENDATILEFYASVFNSKSKPITEKGKTFREVILPGTYDVTDTSNTLATLFHDKNKIIGRSRSGTLKLEVDDYGLKAVVNMGSTQLHKDTIEQVERGDLDECSFIGRVTDWNEKYEDGELIRYIKAIDLLRDVSIVSEGAYAGTNLIIREFMENEKEQVEARENEEVETEEVKNEAPTEEPKEEKPSEEEAPEKTEEAEREEEKPEEPEKEEKVETPEKEEKPEEEEEKEETEPSEEKEVKRDLNNSINTKPETQMNKFELIREAANGQGGSVMIERAAVDGDSTSMSKVVAQGVGELSIMGKEPVWSKMGVDYNPNAKGTYLLPFQDPIVGEKLAELAPVTKDTVTPDGTLVRARRFTTQKVVTLETIASASDEYLSKLISDMEKGCDRQISAEVYTKVLAGASAVSEADISKGGFDALQAGAEIDGEGSFLANRKTFFEAKGTPIDAGSGRFLAELSDADKGKTYEGSNFWYSTLFSDGENQKFVAYGDLSKIHVADYGMNEVIIDKVTKAGEGKIVITVNKLADVALLNPAAFAKSGDLDAAV
ncbi:HK97 family phage prohead protease [Marinilabilia salmonicolor]|uniref:HK97 family phage prohead protease n=1 Tax=Marinilabilia salmonicolor TaxID=989 RepID=UPI000299FCD2|nr:HK97 family phage prohead protease [Marinilabilia salmonicolor]